MEPILNLFLIRSKRTRELIRQNVRVIKGKPSKWIGLIGFEFDPIGFDLETSYFKQVTKNMILNYFVFLELGQPHMTCILTCKK